MCSEYIHILVTKHLKLFRPQYRLTTFQIQNMTLFLRLKFNEKRQVRLFFTERHLSQQSYLCCNNIRQHNTKLKPSINR
jgi:hypothetical protein